MDLEGKNFMLGRITETLLLDSANDKTTSVSQDIYINYSLTKEGSPKGAD